jgi:glutathione peroxidase-family protein
MNRYRFEVGQKVKIRATKTSSVGCREHDGKIVTIKSRCKFTWAYELEELDGLWQDRCFEAV